MYLAVCYCPYWFYLPMMTFALDDLYVLNDLVQGSRMHVTSSVSVLCTEPRNSWCSDDLYWPIYLTFVHWIPGREVLYITRQVFGVFTRQVFGVLYKDSQYRILPVSDHSPKSLILLQLLYWAENPLCYCCDICNCYFNEQYFKHIILLTIETAVKQIFLAHGLLW